MIMLNQIAKLVPDFGWSNIDKVFGQKLSYIFFNIVAKLESDMT